MRNISLSIPIFALTLHGAADRRSQLVNILAANNTAFELWYGVDDRDRLPAEYEAMIDRDAAREAVGREMGNSEFACALSHHFIYRAIMDRELPRAIVLEDDAIIDARFFDFLDQQNTQDYDLLLLDHMRADVFRSGPLQFQGGLTAYKVALFPDADNRIYCKQQRGQNTSGQKPSHRGAS
jgi:glycosyl transferase family 25